MHLKNYLVDMYIIIGILVLMIAITIALTIGCYNLIKQNEEFEEAVLFYQDKFNEIREIALKTEIELKELDIRGAFESDDEVGTVFKNIKAISSELSQNILEAYESGK